MAKADSVAQELKDNAALPKYLTAICYDDFTQLLEDAQADINDASQRWGIPIDDLRLLVDTYNKL